MRELITLDEDQVEQVREALRHMRPEDLFGIAHVALCQALHRTEPIDAGTRRVVRVAERYVVVYDREVNEGMGPLPEGVK